MVESDYGMKPHAVLLFTCPDTESGGKILLLLSKNYESEGVAMDKTMFGLLLAIEGLTDEELKYINVWIEYMLQKKEVLEAPSPKG